MQYIFRTIPSDSLQAAAIADVVENTGARETVVVHVDDAYGRPFAAEAEAALAAGMATRPSLGYPGDKYETGRAMMQMEEDKAHGQLQEAIAVRTFS